MSGGNRLHRAALGGFLTAILWAVASLAQEPQEIVPTALESQPITEGGQTTSEQRAADQGQKSEPTSENLSPSLDKIEAAIRDLIAQERAAQGHGPKDEEIRDLKAQEGMALWAKAMFWATVAAVIITFAGIVLIRYTLKYTKIAAGHTEEMLNEAQASTRAAEDVVEVTRITAERQLRAYVHAIQMRIEFPEEGQIKIKVIAKNFGSTPAYKFRHVSRIDPTPAVPMTEVIQAPVMAALGPTAQFTMPVTRTVPPAHWNNIRDGVSPLYCSGRIDYVDAFDRNQWITYRFEFDAGSKGMTISHEGNDTS